MQTNRCNYFDNNKCRSCTLLEQGSPILPELPAELKKIASAWQRSSKAFGSRAKAKMSVSGTSRSPIIGILDSELQGIELLKCPLHKEIINQALASLPKQISELQIEPYNIKQRTGNLKGIILQTNQNQDQIRLRFIVKENNSAYKEIKIVSPAKVSTSVNIQAVPHQILEGTEEHHLQGEELLWENYNNIHVAFPAQAFMQVTPEVASKLYKKANSIVTQYQNQTVLDLFCGAGGFALSVATKSKKVYGIELSKQAINAAELSAKKNHYNNIEFIHSDLLKSLAEIQAEILICNPPRRGLGQLVIEYIKNNKPELIIYSSCDALSFLKDFEQISKLYKLKEVTPFEMFPLTKHYEILATLERR